MEFHSLGKGFIVAGVGVAVIGLILWLMPSTSWLGRLPGDLYVKRGNFSFYFPLTTCLLVSLIATLLFRFFRR